RWIAPGDQRLGVAIEALAPELVALAARGATGDDVVEPVNPQIILEFPGRQLDIRSGARIADGRGRIAIDGEEAGRIDVIRSDNVPVLTVLPHRECGDERREARHRIADEVLSDAQTDRDHC